MTLLDRIRSIGSGDVGDLSPDDLVLDDQGWYAAEQRPELGGVLGLAAAANATPYWVGGIIRWDRVLDRMIDPRKVDYQPGWLTRGAPVMDREPAAILWHWTAGKPTALRPCPSLVICRDGRPAGKGVTAVPGPLVHVIIGTDGVLHVLASGRANHAGTGHKELIAEMRAGAKPRGSAKQLHLADTGGSGGSLIGVEIENDGTKPFTDAQIDTCARFARSCYRLGLGRVRATHYSHYLWTARKRDVDNGQQDRLIAAYDSWQSLH